MAANLMKYCSFKFSRFPRVSRLCFSYRPLIPHSSCTLSTFKNNNNDKERFFRDNNVKSNNYFFLGLALGSFCGFYFFNEIKGRYFPSRQLLASQINLDSVLEEPKEKISKSKQFNFVANVVEEISSAVVHIEGVGHGRSLLGNMAASGSGFVITEDGLVLTNAHVVKNMRNVQVTFSDGSSFTGNIVCIDHASDLAAIQLTNTNKKKFHTIKLGDSSVVRPGEFVIAMGSPLRLSNTVTSGIVSTVHRAAGDLSRHLPPIEYIQTDAAINVGNSGGPLVNLDSELIGINSMTVKDAVGISFAIPVNVVRDFLQHGVNKMTTKIPEVKGYIGITMLTLTPGIIDELRRRMTWFPNVQYGVFIPEVVYDSPAHRCGIYPGDIIVSINGERVNNAKQVHDSVSKCQLLTFEILRGPKKLKVTVQPQKLV